MGRPNNNSLPKKQNYKDLDFLDFKSSSFIGITADKIRLENLRKLQEEHKKQVAINNQNEKIPFNNSLHRCYQKDNYEQKEQKEKLDEKPIDWMSLTEKQKRKIVAKNYYEKNKEKVQKRNKTYYENNKEKCIKNMYLYQQKNEEKYKTYKKQYAKNNKEKMNLSKKKSYIKRRNNLMENEIRTKFELVMKTLPTDNLAKNRLLAILRDYMNTFLKIKEIEDMNESEKAQK